MGRPKIIFGAATVGMGFDDPQAVEEVLGLLKKHNVDHIDAAGRYPPLHPGLSETLLGNADAVQKGFVLDTKILAGAGDGSGELTNSAIEESLSTSLHRLKSDSVNTLHCHRPDPKTPLVEQASSLDLLYRQGKFKLLGVSNFPPDLLQDFLQLCDAHGYVKPTVYQGEYSAITRAAGFLTGKATAGKADGTRFSDDHPLGKAFLGIFKTDETDAAVKKLDRAAQKAGMPIHEAALRWLFYHSVLGENDGVILGASNITQLQSNLGSIDKGPLEAGLVEVFEDIWADLEEKRGSII